MADGSHMLNSLLSHGLSHGWATSPGRLSIVAAVTVGFALIARGLRGVNRSGAWAGGAVCFVLFAAGGPSAFTTLTVLFILTWGSTRLGYPYKVALGVAERREGRNAWQVLGNLAIAAFASLVFSANGNQVWIIATIAALTEAATDTVASEMGQSVAHSYVSPSSEGDFIAKASTARLITTWRRVPSGTDGGITLIGTVAGLCGGLIIAVVATAGRMILLTDLWIPVAAGFAGMLIDSLLGATVQRRGWISNQSVNFLATLAAAALAVVMAKIFP
jgi:uncharacterized protein (TIGR00297 family)